jgi:hypothetical protein
MSMLRFIFSICVLIPTTSAMAQSLEGFSSGRYEIRKSAPASTPQRHRSLASEEAAAEVKVEVVPAKTEKPVEKTTVKATAKVDSAAAPIVVDANKVSEVPATPEAAAKVAEETAPAVIVEAPKEEPGIQEQAQSLFSAKTEKIYEFYQEKVHPDDIRNNRVEIEFSPAAVYNDSQSDFSFRDYQSYFNALKVASNVWFTPLIGVSGKIMFSFAGDLSANDGTDTRVAAKYEFVDLGVNFRKFFGLSRLSNSLETSILYSEHKMNTPSDNNSRSRLKSQGVGLGLKARMPTSASYAWTVGGSFYPRVKHSESATGRDMSSGDPSESTRLELELGGEIKFSRESQVVWELSASAERNLFDGSAALPDPGTGSTPSNVSVTNSLYMFSLGYRWGH